LNSLNVELVLLVKQQGMAEIENQKRSKINDSDLLSRLESIFQGEGSGGGKYHTS
jgi:hypothetical protein